MHMKKTGFYDRVLRGLYVAPGDFSITSPSGYTCIDVYPVYDVYIYTYDDPSKTNTSLAKFWLEDCNFPFEMVPC